MSRLRGIWLGSQGRLRLLIDWLVPTRARYVAFLGLEELARMYADLQIAVQLMFTGPRSSGMSSGTELPHGEGSGNTDRDGDEPEGTDG